MSETIHVRGASTASLRELLSHFENRFLPGQKVGIKIHWGERGNTGFLHPRYTREIARWLRESGVEPLVFDTTVLYSGGRRSASDSLETAARHGFTEEYLGCPVRIGDGEGRSVEEIPSGFKHFPSVQVASILRELDGLVLFSHFKGHLASGFGGAIKNLSMGLASRAQKQRMHADAHPVLLRKKCNRCGVCADVCPVGAAVLPEGKDPEYNLETCIGCSQCIGLCPQAALKVFWNTDETVFQEKLVETAAAIWRTIGGKTLVINGLLRILSECDCMPGKYPAMAEDFGFIGGGHPVAVDEASVERIGAKPLDLAHPGVPWRRQFSFAREIGFAP